MLQRGEQRVELRQRGAVGGFEAFDGGEASGELLLKGERWNGSLKVTQESQVDVSFVQIRVLWKR